MDTIGHVAQTVNPADVKDGPTAASALAVLSEARGQLTRVEVLRGELCDELVLSFGDVTLTLPADDQELADLLGSSLDWIAANLSIVAEMLRGLQSRSLPLTRGVNGALRLDRPKLLGELAANAKVAKAPSKALCPCGQWADRGAIVKFSGELRRVVACRACVPGLDASQIEVATESEVLEAARRLLYAGLPIQDVTDTHDASRFATTHGPDFRYVSDLGKSERPWLLWNGRHWERETARPIRRLLMQFWFAAKLYAEALARGTDADAKAWQAFVGNTRRRLNRVGQDAILAVVPSFSGVSIRDRALDSEHTSMLLNVGNGTLDLTTGTLREHRREDLLTRLIEIDYDPNAQAPRWDQFMLEVFEGDEEMVSFIQRLFGYVTTGSTREEKFFIFFQEGGGGGKGTMLNAIMEALGPYGRNAEASTLDEDCKETIRSDLKRMENARLMVVNELEAGMALAESLVKKIASGDLITARNRYADETEFRSTVKVVMPTNHLPKIRSGGDATWDRLVIVPFDKKFRGEAGQDKDLAAKLRAELPGILAWLVRGCLAWQAEGLNIPAKVVDATLAVRGRQSGFDIWLDENTVRDPVAWTSTEALHADHMACASAIGMVPCGKSEFGRRLARLGDLEAARDEVDDKQLRGWRGIRLSTPEERAAFEFAQHDGSDPTRSD